MASIKEAKKKVLVVDDEEVIRDILKRYLEGEKFQVTTAKSGEDALRELEKEVFDVALIDLKLPDMSGIELIEKMKYIAPHLIYIMMTGFPTIKLAVKAIQNGAYDFITKPFILEEIKMVINKAFTQQELQDENIKLREINKRLVEIERIKSEVVNTISHEFKTPLTILRGYLTMLKEGTLGTIEGKAKECVEDMLKSAMLLEKLVNNLITLNFSFKKKLFLNKQAVNLEELILEIIKEMYERIKDKKLNLIREFKEGGLLINADKSKLKIALSNLLDNAIKFNRVGGKIILKTKLAGDYVNVIFEDTGIGFPLAEKEKLLKPFSQEDMSITRAFNGLGIGLPVSKTIIEAHGGEFDITLNKEGGTRVQITLPIN